MPSATIPARQSRPRPARPWPPATPRTTPARRPSPPSPFWMNRCSIRKTPSLRNGCAKPLQTELFGTHTAGEEFFVALQQLLGRGDSADLADLIEIHYLCLLLGFGGRYSAGNRGELAQIMNLTGEKIRRIRGR